MKIDAGIIPKIDPSPVRSQKGGSQSFADILGVPGTSGGAPPAQAARFDSLGMFGRARAVDPPSTLRSPSASTRLEGTAVPAAQPKAFDPAAAVGPAGAIAPSGPAGNVRARPVEAAARRHAIPVEGEATIPSGTPTPDVPAMADIPAGDAPEGAIARGAVPRRSEQPPKARYSLLLFEDAGAAEVIVASASLTAEERARLRQRTADILAEFGRVLGRFSVNGGVVPHFTSHLTGGPNGTRTR